MTQTFIKDLAFADVEREIAVTRRVLERLPEAKLDWKVHEKSMPLGRLAMHVANLLQWSVDTLTKDGLDLGSTPPMRDVPTSLADILQTFDRNAGALKNAMSRTSDDDLARTWSLRQGSQVIYSAPRGYVLRTWCLNHLVHHRAQLCVYLRILGAPVPAVYFNSADEPEWVFG
jgi:uncharacterized damage-inducible protein DinB